MVNRRGKPSAQAVSVPEGKAGSIHPGRGNKGTKAWNKRNTAKKDQVPGNTTKVICTTQASAPVSGDEIGDHLFRLRNLLLSETSLREHGYMLENYSPDELELKKRCQGCGKTISQLHKQRLRNKKKEDKTDTSSSSPKEKIPPEPAPDTTPIPRAPVLRCKFHPGTRQKQTPWSCCGQAFSAPPCSGVEHHIVRPYPPGEFEREWKIHATPAPAPSAPTRLAVAIDCEMGTSACGDSELIRITLVDYFTSDVLVDSLVFPAVAMQDLRTRFSGVSWKDLHAARKKGNCLHGRDAARRAVWQFVGPDTVVVGHAAQQDLMALRWLHATVVDTYSLAAFKPPTPQVKEDTGGKETVQELTAEGQGLADGEKPSGPGVRKSQKGCGPRSLKTLALAKLGRVIQDAGNKGHDSLEDAIATRDLAWWAVLNDGNRG